MGSQSPLRKTELKAAVEESLVEKGVLEEHGDDVSEGRTYPASRAVEPEAVVQPGAPPAGTAAGAGAEET